ncbi:MAG: hypothetical protein JSU72_07715 [Deltaproteobacteria bacterium]|nr:MAG: hypothetical protein JSU72_07715 [Deltaproteobacteria bacterium]
MTPKYLVNLVCNCHSLPQSRKDSILFLLMEAIPRAELKVNSHLWRQLLVNAMDVREQFFEAYAPPFKVRIIESLIESVRRLKKAGFEEQIFKLLNHIFSLTDGELSGGETADFLREKLLASPDKKVKAALAAVVMELPATYHRVDTVAAAIHGDYLLAIRAMERLCSMGEAGIKKLYQMLDQVVITPSVAFTLLKIIGDTDCQSFMKRKIRAKIIHRVRHAGSQAENALANLSSPVDLQTMRTAQIGRVKELSQSALHVASPRNQLKEGSDSPTFKRFSETKNRKTNQEGGRYVRQKNHKDQALRRGPALDSGDIGRERLRLSIQLKDKGLPAHL